MIGKGQQFPQILCPPIFPSFDITSDRTTPFLLGIIAETNFKSHHSNLEEKSFRSNESASPKPLHDSLHLDDRPFMFATICVYGNLFFFEQFLDANKVVQFSVRTAPSSSLSNLMLLIIGALPLVCRPFLPNKATWQADQIPSLVHDLLRAILCGQIPALFDHYSFLDPTQSRYLL